jgi:hypothetical protein
LSLLNKELGLQLHPQKQEAKRLCFFGRSQQATQPNSTISADFLPLFSKKNGREIVLLPSAFEATNTLR